MTPFFVLDFQRGFDNVTPFFVLDFQRGFDNIAYAKFDEFLTVGYFLNGLFRCYFHLVEYPTMPLNRLKTLNKTDQRNSYLVNNSKCMSKPS